jgi:hypothetical protein
MPTMSDRLAIIEDKIDLAKQKVDMFHEHRFISAKRDFAKWRREDAIAEAEGRTQAMADAQANADTQALYQPVFSPYGEQPPPPAAGAEPDGYRRKLMRAVRDKLSVFDQRQIGNAGHTVSDMALMDGVDRRLNGIALRNIEELMLRAATVQAEEPHPATLPPPGEFVSRTVVNDAGQKETRWFGRESFIKSMSAPGRVIHRIMNPKTGQILYGPPFDRMPGR